jgi:soluble cytochrome b562
MENVYVKIEQYEDALALVRSLRAKIVEAHATLDHIHELKAQEDAELDNWKHGVDDVVAKIDLIEQTLVK